MSPQKNEKDKEKKQVLLRLSQTLWTDLAEWAEDDFRSINGQIEYLLTEAVRKRKRSKRRGEARKEQEELQALE